MNNDRVVLFTVNRQQPNGEPVKEGPMMVVSHDHMNMFIEVFGTWVRMDLEGAMAAQHAINEAVKALQAKPPKNLEH